MALGPTIRIEVYCVGAAVSPTPTQTVTVTPTRTPASTLTPTQTVTPTRTLTPSVSKSPTQTVTPTKTLTPTVTSSPTLTPTNSATVGASSTPTPSLTPSNTVSPTNSVTRTPTLTPTQSVSPTQSLSWSATPASSVTPTNSVTRTPDASPTPSLTPSVTQSLSLSNTPGPSLTPTNSVSPTMSISRTSNVTPTPTNSVTPTWSVTPTMSVSKTPPVTRTPTLSVTPTWSVTPTQSITVSNSANTCNWYLLTAQSSTHGAPQTVNFVGCGGMAQSVVVSTNDSGPTPICALPAPTTTGAVDIVYQGPCVSGTPTPSPTPANNVTLTIDYRVSAFWFDLTAPLTANLTVSGGGTLQVEGFPSAGDCGSSVAPEGDALFTGFSILAGDTHVEISSGGLTCATLYKRMSGYVTINGVALHDGDTFTAGGKTVIVSIVNYGGCGGYFC